MVMAIYLTTQSGPTTGTGGANGDNGAPGGPGGPDGRGGNGVPGVINGPPFIDPCKINPLILNVIQL